jgi:anthraniloyl-CoA monooxygenase
MKINVIGGGPAGMYFAILMKKADAARDIVIYERNGPDDTFGWGVVFSGKTLANLGETDAESHARITRDFETWDNVDVVHRAEKISIHGNSFSGIARIRLLKILQRRCEELGIQIKFRTDITDFESLKTNCELLVGADGVNSTVREKHQKFFQPSLRVRPNKYIWYGTNQLFHGLTLTFRESSAGVFAAHSYKFNPTTSTFIVECDPQTWSNAGFATMPEEQAREYLAEVFSRDLKGHPLLSNNSKWINFVLVKNKRWSFHADKLKARAPVVLLGDALHTAHFSIGSGTKLAMEDAIALKQSFDETSDIRAALPRFEEMRKPIIEDYQAAAFESMRWFENAREYMHLKPIALAYSLMKRSGRVDDEELRKRDPQFMALYESRTRPNSFRADT